MNLTEHILRRCLNLTYRFEIHSLELKFFVRLIDVASFLEMQIFLDKILASCSGHRPPLNVTPIPSSL